MTGCLYDGNQVIAEFDNTGKVISQHIHGSGLGGDFGSLVYKEELNSAIGLSYFGALYYDAFIERFISRDPMGHIDGPNQYFYVMNNPVERFYNKIGPCVPLYLTD